MKRTVFYALLFVLGAAAVIGAARSSNKRKDPGKATWWAPSFQYNFKTHEIQLLKAGRSQAWLKQDDSLIFADRIVWNRKRRLGKCYGNVLIRDKENKYRIRGDEARHDAAAGHSLVRKKPVLEMMKEGKVRLTVYAKVLHRYMKRDIAEAHRDVKIVSDEGVARGQKAVFDTKKDVVTLTGEPTLKQKKDTHEADKIIMYRNERKAILQGDAILRQGTDNIRADKVVIFDIRKKKVVGGKQVVETNRQAYCYGNVRIYRYTQKGKLESITSGGYAEFDQQSGYAKVMAGPLLVNVSDNALISGAVMEQFRKDKIALIKGNVLIRKQYRTVSAQLARYFSEDKKMYLTGDPVITEYNDKFRSDSVVYNMSNNHISWSGNTIAVVGAGDDYTKQNEWYKQNGGVQYNPGGTQPPFTAATVVGPVFVSGSPESRSNSDGTISWGRQVESPDLLPAGRVYLHLHEQFGWCDLYGGADWQIRYRGPGWLKLHSLKLLSPYNPRRTNKSGTTDSAASNSTATNSTAINSAATNSGATNLSTAGKTAVNSGATNRSTAGKTAINSGATNRSTAGKTATDSAATNSSSTNRDLNRRKRLHRRRKRLRRRGAALQNGVMRNDLINSGTVYRRDAQSVVQLAVSEGTLLVRRADTNAPASRLQLAVPWAQLTNFSGRTLVQVATNRIRIHHLGETPLQLQLQLPAFKQLQCRTTNGQAAWEKALNPVLERSCSSNSWLLMQQSEISNINWEFNRWMTNLQAVQQSNYSNLLQVAATNSTVSNRLVKEGVITVNLPLTNRALTDSGATNRNTTGQSSSASRTNTVRPDDRSKSAGRLSRQSLPTRRRRGGRLSRVTVRSNRRAAGRRNRGRSSGKASPSGKKSPQAARRVKPTGAYWQRIPFSGTNRQFMLQTVRRLKKAVQLPRRWQVPRKLRRRTAELTNFSIRINYRVYNELLKRRSELRKRQAQAAKAAATSKTAGRNRQSAGGNRR